MFHVWYNFNIKVTTKTNLLIRGMKRGSKVVQECFYEHCYLSILMYLNTYITSMIYVLCNTRALQQLFLKYMYLKLLSIDRTFIKRIPISCTQVLLSKMY